MKRLFVFILLVTLATINIYAAEYHVDTKKKNMVKFISDAPIESFEGVTSKIDGFIFNETDGFKNAELYFEVDMNSIETGIGLRDRHMRDDYLHTKKYPTTHYEGVITEVSKVSDKKYKVKAKGKMFIHGVTQDKIVEAELIEDSKGNLNVICKFIVALTDYKIEVPSLMFAKIDENMDLRLNFFLKKVSE